MERVASISLRFEHGLLYKQIDSYEAVIVFIDIFLFDRKSKSNQVNFAFPWFLRSVPESTCK